jgi:predicted deacylase
VLARFLKVSGTVPGGAVPAPGATRLLASSADDYVYALDDGLFEPAVEPGAEVTAGDVAGLLHFPDTPWRDPVTIHFESDGIITCKRPLATCQRGDCLYQLGKPWPDAFD